MNRQVCKKHPLQIKDNGVTIYKRGWEIRQCASGAIQAKAILSVSKVYDYVINSYIGCRHGCTYCYARFMKRFTGHKEPWGEFVDVKINTFDLLQVEIQRKKRGSVWVSGVCDPYQPPEAKYKLSRSCLELLKEHHWPVIVQTRSPLILRDIDIILYM